MLQINFLSLVCRWKKSLWVINSVTLKIDFDFFFSISKLSLSRTFTSLASVISNTRYLEHSLCRTFSSVPWEFEITSVDCTIIIYFILSIYKLSIVWIDHGFYIRCTGIAYVHGISIENFMQYVIWWKMFI